MSAVEASVFRHPSSTVDQVVLNADGSFGGELNDVLGSKLDLAGGKILQIVRATDSTDRNTTSDSFQDITGISVTITPQKNDSAILLLFNTVVAQARISTAGDERVEFVITDASNNTISGGAARIGRQSASSDFSTHLSMFAYATPATTSAVTYKARFRCLAAGGATIVTSVHQFTPGQLYAIEVSA